MPPLAPFELTFPAAETEYLKQQYQKAATILEYGSGGSTILAAEHGTPCLSVESDAAWAMALNAALDERFSGQASAKVLHVDIGPTKEWGYPATTEHWDRYWRYPLAIWNQMPGFVPDLVLIDGRMRKACFAAVMLKTQQPAKVLVDDYTGRDYYHDIEQLVPLRSVQGRIAEFLVYPGMLAGTDPSYLIPWFFDVR